MEKDWKLFRKKLDSWQEAIWISSLRNTNPF